MKYTFFSFLLTFFLFSSCSFAQIKEDKDGFVVVSDGSKISLKACVEANTKIMGNSVNVPDFCKCFVPKFYETLKGDAAAVKAFEERNYFSFQFNLATTLLNNGCPICTIIC